MPKYLIIIAGLALASCATQRQLTPARPPAEATSGAADEGPAYTPDVLTGHTTKPAPQPPRRLLGLLLPPKKVAGSPQKVVSDKLADGKLPRKCKGCTIVYGDAVIAEKKAQVAAGPGATASVIGKKAGPTQVASDSSTQNALLGAGNLAAVQGDGNTLPQTTTTQQAADWRATLAKPVGYALAALGTVAIVGGCIFLIAAYKRRNLLHNNG